MARERPVDPSDLPSTDAGLPRLGLILLAAVTLAWGVSWPAMKIVLFEMSPWTFRVISVPVAGLIMMGLVRLSGLSLAVPRNKWAALIIVSFINIGGWQMFSALGLAHLSSGRAVLVAYTMPVWASLFSALILGESLKLRLVGALALGMAGVGTLMWGDLEVIGASKLGVTYMLIAAVSWGLGIVLLKKVDWGMPTLSLAAWQLVVASVPIVVAGWIAGGVVIPQLTPLGLGMLVFVILIPICFCSYAFFKIVSLFPANISAIGTLMIPVLGVFSGALILGEAVGWRELAAMIMIGSAMVLTLITPRRRKTPATEVAKKGP
ncbi:MAG: DMT family transporter [Rhodospirillales bacterium]|jgi:drug/metabolite transporter (DMT)-like permease|nr:DMT family transporter [Rhodospirillales bacterium]